MGRGTHTVSLKYQVRRCEGERIRGRNPAGTHIDAIGIYHNIVLVEVRRAQEIKSLLILRDASAAVVGEHNRRRSGGLIVGRKPEQVTTVVHRDIVRLLERDRMVFLTAFGGPGCGVPREEAGAKEGDERYGSHG